jgi:hypothetical protein
MVEARAELTEWVRWVRRVANQAECKPAVPLNERDLSQIAVWVGIAMFLRAQELAIPGGTQGEICHGQRDDDPPGIAARICRSSCAV